MGIAMILLFTFFETKIHLSSRFLVYCVEYLYLE